LRKILLTSAGFNNKAIERKFLELAQMEPKNIRVLFVPTAAINPDAKAMVPFCRKDLTDAGISNAHIKVYDLDSPMEYSEMKEFHVIYFCGGSTAYLIERINSIGFNKTLAEFIYNDGIYIGVSAGSIIATADLPEGLHYINCKLKVHQELGSQCGKLQTNDCPVVSLTDNQAIVIVDNDILIIE
jgi:peptidase E